MKTYLVMECHDAYAVVLSSDGRFMKVANFQYEVGSTLNRVEPVKDFPLAQDKKNRDIPKWFVPVASLAASFVLIFLGAWQFFFATYGQLDMRINPSVSMDINRMDQVIHLTGTNEDGHSLIEGYDYKWKSTEEVSNELVDRAIEMGFLQEDGQVQIKARSKNQSWVVEVEDRIVKTIINKDHGLTIHVTIENKGNDDHNIDRNPEVYVIPAPTLESQEPRPPLPKIQPAPAPSSPAPEPVPETTPEPPSVNIDDDDDWDDDDWDDDDYDDDDYYDDDYYDDDYYDDDYYDDDWDDDYDDKYDDWDDEYDDDWDDDD